MERIVNMLDSSLPTGREMLVSPISSIQKGVSNETLIKNDMCTLEFEEQRVSCST